MNKIHKILLCAALSAAVSVTGCKNDDGNQTAAVAGGGDPYFENYEYVENPTTTGTGGNEAVGEIKLDTLCMYRPGYHGQIVTAIQNISQLNAFLDTTKYHTMPYKTKEITSAPDFQKWTYFAFSGGPHAITDISHGENTVTVSYKRYVHPPCVTEPCPDYTSIPPNAAVYFIPYTEKAIVFADKTNESVVQFDTLCAYDISSYVNFPKNNMATAIQNDSQMTVFLNFTKYNDEYYRHDIKQMTSTPDFKKWTYFALAGWPCIITDISQDDNTMTVTYKEKRPPPCVEDDPALCPQYSRPADVAFIYFIPYTEKTVAFVDITWQTNE